MPSKNPIPTTLVTLRHIATIRGRDPILAETVQQLADAINHVQLGTSVVDSPDNIGGLSVTQQNGNFDITITDHSSINRSIQYFVEWATNSNFIGARTISLGSSRTMNIALGSLGGAPTYWRAYSQYPNSKPSSPVYAQGNPIVSGGTVSPAPQPSTGSGTGTSTGQQPGQGYGNNPQRPLPPFFGGLQIS
jgi:hypothetical protein